MPECADALSERRDRKNDVDMMSKCSPFLRAIASAFGTFGSSMKPKCSATRVKRSEIGVISTRSSSLGPRRVGGDDGQNDVVLVQHLVVLEIVQQRGRREVRIAGEEHRGARHDVRRLLLQAADQRIDRHLDAARLLNQDAASRAAR